MIDKNNKAICAMPWVHLNFEPDGKVVPCCLTSYHNYYIGDLNTDTISEIWNSENQKKLRRQMMSGEIPDICKTCTNQEKATGHSTRLYHNAEFKDVLERIPETTLEDGTCTEMKLKYWDFRFSNLCNFKCRSCGPRYSSAWVPDAKALNLVSQEKVWSIPSVNNNTNYDFLRDHVQDVEKIYFAGGEPLLMPEHWQTLDLLVEHKRFDLQIKYNTNCSVLTYNKKNAVDYWKLWEQDKIEIWPSIDEIGERAELIRSGTVWSKVEENLKTISELDNVKVRLGMTIGAWNVFRIPEIVNHMIEIGVIKERHQYKNFFVNMLMEPKHYHVQILPDDFKKEVVLKLESFIAEHNKKYNTSINFIFTHLLHDLKQPFDVESALRFLKTTDRVDQIRNESLFDVIPEMNVVKQGVK